MLDDAAPTSPGSVSEAALQRISVMVETRFGLSRNAASLDRLRTVLGPLSGGEQIRLADRLAQLPETDPAWRQLVESMLVHETFFYRHGDQLDVVAREVLPWMARRRETSAPLRIWCAGCSTGEEAYTLAFLLRETGCPGRVIATDLSAASIAVARMGRYRNAPGLNSFRRMSSTAWKHFIRDFKSDGWWSVAADIRALVEFGVHNLMTPRPLGATADLISCRNTLIYFSDESLRRVEATLLAASRPGTVLLLGPAERLRYTDVFVPMTQSHPQIFYWPPDGP